MDEVSLTAVDDKPTEEKVVREKRVRHVVDMGAFTIRGRDECAVSPFPKEKFQSPSTVTCYASVHHYTSQSVITSITTVDGL